MSGSDPNAPNGARGRPGRGFDPLSSLFEPPDPAFDGLSTGGGPRPQAAQVAAAALTDEKFRAPPDVAPPAAPASPALDREAIAKAMAKAAMAKLAAQPAPPAPAAPPASPKAASKPAARPAPPPPAKVSRPVSALEAARLAAAAEDAARQAAAQEAATLPVVPAAVPVATAAVAAVTAAAAATAASVASGARGGTAAQMFAATAPSLATIAPAAPPVAAPGPVLAAADAARAALRTHGAEVDVPLRGAVAAPRGPVLGVLWKSHRLRALAEGDLALAHAAARVIEAIDSSPESLVVAVAGAAGQEHLLFVDARGGRLLAVCANARAYIAATGLQL